MKGHRLFRSIWALANLLLVVSAVFLLYALCWEYSTRQYLGGFSDAIVPANAPPEEKVQAILDWMKSGPARKDGTVAGAFLLRNPEETLNYRELLRVCGSAANAFINLASTSGLRVRRLLLLDERGLTTHVDTEVLTRRAMDCRRSCVSDHAAWPRWGAPYGGTAERSASTSHRNIRAPELSSRIFVRAHCAYPL